MSSSKRRRRARQASMQETSNGSFDEPLRGPNAAEESAAVVDSTPESEPVVSYSPPPQPRYAQQEFERIGDKLRRERERRGEDIDYISDYLRIRPGFLSALENSRYEEFPADAYVIGFLRSYANYLGLDGRDAIDHYRHEMAGRRRRPTLNMPQPISEGRAPTVAILIGAAVAAILIYGLWYSLSSSDRAVVSAPPVLPQTAAAVATSTAADTEHNNAAPVVASLPIATATSASAVPETDAVTGTATGATVTATATNNATPTSPPTSSDKTPTTPDTQDASTGTTEAPKGQVFGDAAATKPRVVLQADNESWILIADSHGITVFDRVLKPGETYIVPSAKGLTLTTGNASGLILKVDGVELPRIVSSSRVVRAVPLDPEKLKARQRPTTE